MRLSPLLTNMIDILANQCIFPDDYDPKDAEEVDNFRIFRRGIADCSHDIGFILGAASSLNAV